MGIAFNIPVAFVSLIGNRVIVQISNLALLLFAARLLSPAEIGEFALASAVSLLMLCIAQAGWRQVVLAWTETPDPPPTVFWSALIAGLAGAIVGALVAGGAIKWLGGGDFGWLLLIFSALIPAGAVATVQYGMLNRRGQLAAIAGIGSVAAVLGLVAGFAALMLGAGVYALAVSRVVRDATSLLWVCAVARWVPRPEIDLRVLPRILSFTWRITIAQLLQFGYMVQRRVPHRRIPRPGRGRHLSPRLPDMRIGGGAHRRAHTHARVVDLPAREDARQRPNAHYRTGSDLRPLQHAVCDACLRGIGGDCTERRGCADWRRVGRGGAGDQPVSSRPAASLALLLQRVAAFDIGLGPPAA